MAIKVLLGTPALNGSSGVQSVTGDGVNNTDPSNPVLSYPTPDDIGALESGDNVSQLVNDAIYETNTINSTITGEPTGSDVILNTVSLTQAEYDAGTPIATTLYIITDA